MSLRGRPREAAADVTRQERRDRRRQADRQRLPKHGKGFGLMVRNAVRRRDQEIVRREPRDPDGAD